MNRQYGNSNLDNVFLFSCELFNLIQDFSNLWLKQINYMNSLFWTSCLACVLYFHCADWAVSQPASGLSQIQMNLLVF